MTTPTNPAPSKTGFTETDPKDALRKNWPTVQAIRSATNPAPESAGPCGHHYSWGQRCQQPPDAEVHKWGLAQYGHSTPDGMPRHPWTPLYADTPLSTPAAPQPETEGMMFGEWLDRQFRLNPAKFGSLTYDELRAAWTAAKNGGRS